MKARKRIPRILTHLAIVGMLMAAVASATTATASGEAFYPATTKDITVLLNERSVTVTPDGDQRTVVRRKLRINSAAAAARYVAQEITWQEGRVSPFLLGVTVTRAGDQVFHLGPQQDGPDIPLYPASPMPSPIARCVLPSPDLQRGDILEWAVELRAQPLIKGHFFANMNWQLQHAVSESIFTVTVPKGKEIEWRSWGKAPEPVVTEDAEQCRYVWHAEESIAPRDPTQAIPNAQTWISSGANWPEIANWYLCQLEKSGTRPDLLRDQAADIIEGLDDYRDRVVALVSSVSSAVATAESAEVIDLFCPRPPSQVLSSRRGDCKDKAWLMVNLLQAAGLQAHIGLVCLGRSQPPLREQLPTPLFFDHTVVGISGPGRMLWVDPTGAAAHELDAARTLQALVITADRPVIVTIDGFVRS